jgi:cation diffusion facilitator family transporter
MSEQVHTVTSSSTAETGGKTQRLLVLSAIVDLALGLLKIIVGWFANSHALIADGIHSFSDLATDLMVWVLNRIGAEEPDDDHPYGHARFETFGALILGIILILVAGILVYDSVLRLIQIGSISIPTWPAILAAIVSIAAKEWLYRITRQLGDRVKSNLLIANAWHHRSDAVSSVIVLIGVSGAMLGVAWLEMIAAIGVAFMIAIVGWKLTRESVEELVDTALSETYVADIQDATRLADGVRDVHSLRTRRMGSAVILDIHLQVDPTISVSEGHYIGDWVSQQLRRKFQEISDITVHIDAEDDAEGIQEFMPPLRKEVRRALLEAWDGLLGEDEVEKITLHYLKNAINIELFLSTRVENKEDLRLKLAQSANKFQWMGKISIWLN